MPKVKTVEFAGFEDVYNMEVDGVHNFAINGGIIVHNCDECRYYSVYWTGTAKEPEQEKPKTAKELLKQMGFKRI